MNKTTSAICFLIILLGLGCTKTEEPKSDLPQINLISPIGAYDAPPDYITFEWEGPPDESSQLTISKGNNFDFIFTDTLVNNNFFLATGFIPNATYSWRISVANQMEEAQFTTLDLIGEVEGAYDVEVHEYWWEGNVTLLDTTYTETILLEKVDNKIKAQFERYGIENVLSYSSYQDERYVYTRLGGLSLGSELYIDRINRIIDIEAREGGLSYGKYFNVSFAY